MTVKRATPKRVYINNASDLLHDPAYTQVLGLLLFANENCELIEAPKPVEVAAPQPTVEVQAAPQPTKKEKKKTEKKKSGTKQGVFHFFEKMQNFGGTMFSDQEEEDDEE